MQIRAAGREARQSAHRREREKRMEEALLRPPSKLFFFRQVLAPFVFTRFFFHSLFLLVFFFLLRTLFSRRFDLHVRFFTASACFLRARCFAFPVCTVFEIDLKILGEGKHFIN